MTVRLIFAFLFQWTVSAAGRVLAWIIPDRPRSLDLKIKREEFLAKEALRNYKIKTGKRQAERDIFEDASEDEDDDGETNRSSAPYATPDNDNDKNSSGGSSSKKVKNRKKRGDSNRSTSNNSRDKLKNSSAANSHHSIDIELNDGKQNATWHRHRESCNTQT